MESFWRRATPYSFAQKAPSINLHEKSGRTQTKVEPHGQSPTLQSFGDGASPWHPSSEAELLRRTDLQPRRSPTHQSYGDGANPADTLSAFIVRRQSPAMDDGVHGQSPWLSADAIGYGRRRLRRRVKVNFQQAHKKRPAKNKNCCKWSWQLSAI